MTIWINRFPIGTQCYIALVRNITNQSNITLNSYRKSIYSDGHISANTQHIQLIFDIRTLFLMLFWKMKLNLRNSKNSFLMTSHFTAPFTSGWKVAMADYALPKNVNAGLGFEPSILYWRSSEYTTIPQYLFIHTSSACSLRFRLDTSVSSLIELSTSTCGKVPWALGRMNKHKIYLYK